MTSPDETSPTISGTAPRDDVLVAGVDDLHAPGQAPGGEGPSGPDIRYSPVSPQAKGQSIGPVEAKALGLDGGNVTQGQVDVQTGQQETPEKPAKNASTDDWRQYALTHGGGADEVAAMSRDELVEHYG